MKEVLRKFGELKTSEKIAKSIIKSRPILNTGELKSAIRDSIGGEGPRRLAQVFQALRILTNGEFEDLEKLCAITKDRLTTNGIGLMITFHSLERNIINKFLKENKQYLKK